jgi:hypothetical protein
MGDPSPHLLSDTIIGCFLVVPTLAVALVIGCLIVLGLLFLPLILMTRLIPEAVSRMLGERPGKPATGDQARKAR